MTTRVIEPRADYCPKNKSHTHSFHDYTYWGSKHPKCSRCGYEDKTRILNKGKTDDHQGNRKR